MNENMNENNIYKKAIATYGKALQTDVAIEEMSELIKELCKAQRGKADREHIAEEIADVEIMLEQIKIMYDIHNAGQWKIEKVLRLERRLSNDTDGGYSGE